MPLIPLPPEFAQDPAELFDVVRADGTPTGEVKPRAAVHRDGDWHRAVHVWVAGIDAEYTIPAFPAFAIPVIGIRAGAAYSWDGPFRHRVGAHAGVTYRP